MHALHNAELIRASLPRHLVTPKPYIVNRHSSHLESAAKLRAIRSAKRAATKAKAAETRRKKAQANALAESSDDSGDADEEHSSDESDNVEQEVT